jgi:hypothetical protein
LLLLLIQAEDSAMLLYIGKLSSHITAKDAKSKLLRMRKDRAKRSLQKPLGQPLGQPLAQPLKVSAALFLGAHSMLQRYSFPLPMRRFILELFDDVAIDWSTPQQQQQQQQQQAQQQQSQQQQQQQQSGTGASPAARDSAVVAAAADSQQQAVPVAVESSSSSSTAAAANTDVGTTR